MFYPPWDAKSDPQWANTPANTIAIVEMDVGIIAASLVVMRPCFQAIYCLARGRPLPHPSSSQGRASGSEGFGSNASGRSRRSRTETAYWGSRSRSRPGFWGSGRSGGRTESSRLSSVLAGGRGRDDIGKITRTVEIELESEFVSSDEILRGGEEVRRTGSLV